MPHGETGLGELGAVVQGFGDAKVRQHGGAVGAEQNVRWLDVAVDQPLRMGITQAAEAIWRISVRPCSGVRPAAMRSLSVPLGRYSMAM